VRPLPRYIIDTLDLNSSGDRVVVEFLDYEIRRLSFPDENVNGVRTVDLRLEQRGLEFKVQVRGRRVDVCAGLRGEFVGGLPVVVEREERGDRFDV
jgi:hypothetical protein